MKSLTVSDEVLALLRCPRSKQPLHVAGPEELEKVRATVHAIRPEDPEWEGALLTADGATAYPIDDGYPILLLDRAVNLAIE